MRVYVSVGHGVKPNGVFDPGAVDPATGAREYDGNRALALEVTARLRGLGVDVVSESDQPAGTDPDYQGSVDNVNAERFDFALDLHQDWSGGSSAEVWPLVHPNGTTSSQVAAAMVREASARGLTVKGPTARTDLWWLNGTYCPAVLVESGRVGTPRNVPGIADALVGAISSTLAGTPPGETFPPPTSPGAPPGDSTVKPPDGYPPFPGRLLEVRNPLLEGGDVETWQAQMSKRGWSIDVDGIYGPQSSSVCLWYQGEKGLDPDGIVGPVTWQSCFTAPVT